MKTASVASVGNNPELGKQQRDYGATQLQPGTSTVQT